jgi:hypothetical protein
VSIGFGLAVFVIGLASTTQRALDTARVSAERLGSDPVPAPAR